MGIISQKDLKLLWGRSAARCALCKSELAEDKKAAAGTYPIGEQAHIIAEEPDGPRGESILTVNERNSYHNLILLCPTHHTVIDRNIDDYPVERLFLFKSQHELWVRETLSSGEDLQEVAALTRREALLEFVREWRDFYSFFLTFHTLIQGYLLKSENDMRSLVPDIQEWGKRIRMLRELLFRVGEENLIIQTVPDWEKLKENDDYIMRRGYLTPFSYLLDGKAPIAFVNHHGTSSWRSLLVSHEYLEYLSYRYDEIKAIMADSPSDSYYSSKSPDKNAVE